MELMLSTNGVDAQHKDKMICFSIKKNPSSLRFVARMRDQSLSFYPSRGKDSVLFLGLIAKRNSKVSLLSSRINTLNVKNWVLTC